MNGAVAVGGDDGDRTVETVIFREMLMRVYSGVGNKEGTESCDAIFFFLVA